MEESRLFKPLTVGKMQLQHRIGMCPLTRFRADSENVPTPLMIEYYSQRASVPGTLLTSEGTFISPAQAGYDNAPGIWNEAQVRAWRPITDAVHARGSFIVCQLWALGRASRPAVLARRGFEVTSASALPLPEEGAPVPVPLTTEQVRQTVEDYAHAARNAIRAGFDAVEVHGANGYLIDQFIQDVTNQRTDEYGGSVESRSRFALEVVRAVAAAVGPDRVGIRFSPWGTFGGMRMADPIPQFSDLLRRLDPLGLAFVHLVESRANGGIDQAPSGTLDFAYALWGGLLLVAGGYEAELARRLVDEEHPDKQIVVMFGRYFISNPDLPFRIRRGIPFAPYDRGTFYTPGSVGYTDLPFSKEFLAENQGVSRL